MKEQTSERLRQNKGMDNERSGKQAVLGNRVLGRFEGV